MRGNQVAQGAGENGTEDEERTQADDQGVEQAVDCRAAPTARPTQRHHTERGMRQGTAGGAWTTH
eukprot:10758403-Alexandrium_andersonii.AAC.1